MTIEIQRRDFLKLSSALALSSFAPSIFAADKKPFPIYGSTSLPCLTIAVAALEGDLADKFDVSLQIWRSPDQLRKGVASGAFKVMMTPSNVGLNLRNHGQKVGMVDTLTDGFIQLMSKTPIESPEQLVGKNVIIPFQNDIPDIIFRALLDKRGIGAKNVKITYAKTPMEAGDLLLRDGYDAAFLSEPFASSCMLKGRRVGVSVHRCFDFEQAWAATFGGKPITPNAGIIADVDFFHAHQAEFELLHQDLKNAAAWVKNNPQSAAEIGMNYLPTPAPSVAESISHAKLAVHKASELKEDLLKFYEIILRYNPKLIGEKLPDDGFFLL